MRRLVLLAPLLVLLSGSTACVTSPLNGAPALPSTGTSVKFSGYAPGPGQLVQIEASQNGSTGWSTIASAYTSRTPTEFWDGTTLHSFTVTSAVTFVKWQQTSCTESETFVRFRVGSSILLPSFDHQNVSGVHPASCITQQQNSGAGFFEAMSACRSPDSPVIRLTAQADHTTGTYFGDLVIDDPGDLAVHACRTAVQGNLTIGGGYGLDVSLPALQTVTGDLNLSYPRQTMTFFPDVRAPDLPALTTVGGDLNLDSPAPEPSQVTSIPFGLNALSSVGGDITVTVDTFNYDGSGFDSLTSLAGNLTFITGSGDSFGIFRQLQTIGGDVLLDIGHNTGSVLDDLVSVGGDLTFAEGNPTPTTLPSLTTVTGDFTIGDVTWNAPPGIVLTQLTTVGGRLTVDTSDLNQLGIGAPAYTAGALTVTGNPDFVGLNLGNLQVVGPGSIEVTNNPQLCASEVSAFLAAQASWTGASTVSGNDDGC